jgi:hypothetical protein
VNGDTPISSEKFEEEICRCDEGAGASELVDSECDDGHDSDENENGDVEVDASDSESVEENVEMAT